MTAMHLSLMTPWLLLAAFVTRAAAATTGCQCYVCGTTNVGSWSPPGACGSEAEATDHCTSTFSDGTGGCYTTCSNGCDCATSTCNVAYAYTHLADTACFLRNDLGIYSDTASGCAARCDAIETCTSFEFKAGNCQLSSTCTTAIAAPDGTGWSLFVRDGQQTHGKAASTYALFERQACTDANELGTLSGESIATCAARCSALPTCVSFEYRASDSTCQFSSSCTPAHAGWSTDLYTSWSTYLKHAYSAPPISASGPAGAAGDPHLTLPHGGTTDFRGRWAARGGLTLRASPPHHSSALRAATAGLSSPLLAHLQSCGQAQAQTLCAFLSTRLSLLLTLGQGPGAVRIPLGSGSRPQRDD